MCDVDGGVDGFVDGEGGGVDGGTIRRMILTKGNLF